MELEDYFKKTLLTELEKMFMGTVFKRKVGRYYVYSFALEFICRDTWGLIRFINFNPKTKTFTSVNLKQIFRLAKYERISDEEQAIAKQMMRKQYVKGRLREDFQEWMVDKIEKMIQLI